MPGRRKIARRVLDSGRHTWSVEDGNWVHRLLRGCAGAPQYRFEELQSVRLSNGQTFAFGPHGEWFTEAETKALQERREWTSIPWQNGVELRLPPK
jgi:hypothetical protein